MTKVLPLVNVKRLPAYADISEMLAARRPAGITKNDPAIKEQTMATIANVKVRPEEVESQIGVAKLREDIKNAFTGGNRDELMGRLEARVKSPDAGRESTLGPALVKLNQWAFGTKSFDPEGAAQDSSAPPVMPVALVKSGAPQAVAEQVRTIREDLEDEAKAGKIKTRDDALDFVARKATALVWKGNELLLAADGAKRAVDEQQTVLPSEEEVWPAGEGVRSEVYGVSGDSLPTPHHERDGLTHPSKAEGGQSQDMPPEAQSPANKLAKVEEPPAHDSGAGAQGTTTFTRVIVSGGINSEFDKDQSHDRHWGNYVRAAETEIKRAKKHDKDGESIEWHVQKSSLEDRASMERQPEDYYTKQVAEIAEKEGVRLRWFNTTRDFVGGINTAPDGGKRSGNSLISNFKFFGHGGESSIWMTYRASTDGSPPQGGEVLMSTDLPSRRLSAKHRATLLNLPSMAGRVIDPAAFAPGAVCTSWACNSAAGKPAFVDAWTASLGVSMMGIDGKSDYGPTSPSYAPWSFEYGDLLPSKGRPPMQSAHFPIMGERKDGGKAFWRVANP
jgi:hypothetical protein